MVFKDKKGVNMSDISFKSTYKIPVNQWGINNSKKLQLKSLVSSYNGLITGKQEKFALLSIPDKKDKGFIQKLFKIGYREYQQFVGEKIANKNLEEYVANLCKQKN